MPRIRAASIAEHKEMTRREILEAATRLFQSQGYSETSLGDIAAYVGIGRTTLYEYFSDKEDILACIVEETLPEVISAIVERSRRGGTARERLTRLLSGGLEFVSDDRHLGPMVMKELPRLTGPSAGRVWQTHDLLGKEIMTVVRDGIESGEFGAFDPAAAGQIVTSLLMSASQALIRTRGPVEQRRALAETLTRFVFDGLGAR